MESKRKGARKLSEIPTPILNQLNKGDIESANLMEWLAINPLLLVQAVFKNRKKYLTVLEKKLGESKKLSTLQTHQHIGYWLYEISTKENDSQLLTFLQTYKADAVRCWACYVVCANINLNLTQKIKALEALATDAHFGVRELAWMALRPSIANELTVGINELAKWSLHKNENLRRFASECTRPRGVWCSHINALKENPELGLDILEPLKSDSSKYVRDSVGNWLNDAAKTQAQWVKLCCARWQNESKTKETDYIIKRALRSL